MVDSNKLINMVMIPSLMAYINIKGNVMAKNDDNHAPVTTWENEKARGLALCAEYTFRERVEHAQSLRDRHAAYLGTLPTDPREVILATQKIMHPTGDDYPDGIEEALHLSCALEALVREGDLDAQGQSRDAAIYVASQVSFAMHRAIRQLDRIADILGNPGRIESDG